MSVTQGDNRQASQKKKTLKMTSKKMREFLVGGNKHQSGLARSRRIG